MAVYTGAFLSVGWAISCCPGIGAQVIKGRASQMFLEFIAEQWMLVAALTVCIGLLVRHESAKGGPGLSPQQLVTLVNREQAVVVDLRDSKEYDAGHIVDAINIPFAKLSHRMVELDAHKEKPVVLVCKMGQHAGSAGKQLLQAGFGNVSRLSGGMLEWQNSQLPLVSK